MECCLACCLPVGATAGNLFNLDGLVPATEFLSDEVTEDPGGILTVPDDTLFTLLELGTCSRTKGVPPDNKRNH